jgi:hypothetical protein
MSGIARSPKRLLLVAAAILAAAAIALLLSVSTFAKSPAPPPRNEPLHLTKECSQYTGNANSFCTINSSNLATIKVGSRIVILQAIGKSMLDSDVVLVVGPGSYATGHCKLPLPAGPGLCTWSGGKGSFAGFHAQAAVTPDSNIAHGWYMDGTYRFDP